jgi:hypothetical protein
MSVCQFACALEQALRLRLRPVYAALRLRAHWSNSIFAEEAEEKSGNASFLD